MSENGKIVGIVPDVAGCKDYVFKPCELNDLIKEFDDEVMVPNLEHYKRWAEFGAPDKPIEPIFESNRSIHVHFYTARNISALLAYAVDKLGFSWFSIKYAKNHKDFYFVLSR